MTPEGGSWGYPYIKIFPYRYTMKLISGQERLQPHHQGLCPLLFLNIGVGSLTSQMNRSMNVL